MNEMNLTALTFNIQQFSTEDGPGIRTTVFMKGCPLRCVWCHNPEGASPHLDLVWYDTRCIAARECLRVCPENALTLTPSGMVIDRKRCTVCGKCAEQCPASALEIIGKEWTVDELLAELLKDKVFYETSGGGITFSGGEPMMQTDFLCEILPRCKEAGLHVALDTCGAVSAERYQRVIEWIDLVLFDLKIMDDARHRAATGVGNELILNNVRLLAMRGVPMWIRTPIIPGYTDDRANIEAIARFIRDNLPTVERWDLLAYTNLGKPKYHRLDLPYALENVPLLTRDEMESVWQIAHEIVPVARWSGATRQV
ncbi:MAG: glycyl-radical enzyme activating protein [candidate division KSB1 bacterium]|nr:glycyl-radical enzyme activating protein [candidate division KSB1 bacterium]